MVQQTQSTVVIAMGSVNDTIEETIDYLTAAGKKVGVVRFVFTDHSPLRHFFPQFRKQ